MDVSVIIVNYNTNELLAQCIHSVIDYPRDVAYEIIVVDNNSNEFTPDDYTSISNNIEIVRLSRNIGFGKANNEGVKIANGELVLFLNSDTLLLNDAISMLYHHMKKQLEYVEETYTRRRVSLICHIRNHSLLLLIILNFSLVWSYYLVRKRILTLQEK